MKDVLQLDERGLEEWLSEPLAATRAALQKIEGDVAVLGAGGKMGPTLALMLKKAAPAKKAEQVLVPKKNISICERARGKNLMFRTHLKMPG
jgi:hypothetical protein